MASPSRALALGLDAGGSGTRWALADATGQVRAQGVGPGFWVLGLSQVGTRQAVAALLAGTGSMAAPVDAQGVLHRVGGRGALLGDEGSGQWIALRALALLWRREDEAPGRAGGG